MKCAEKDRLFREYIESAREMDRFISGASLEHYLEKQGVCGSGATVDEARLKLARHIQEHGCDGSRVR